MAHDRCNNCARHYYCICDLDDTQVKEDGVFCWSFLPDFGTDSIRLYRLNESWCAFKQCLNCIMNDYCDKELPDTQPCPNRLTNKN